MADFAERFRALSDSEVMNLYMQRDTLEPEAQELIRVEFLNRKLSEDEASALRQEVVRDYDELTQKQNLAIVGVVFGLPIRMIFAFGRWFSDRRKRDKSETKDV